MWKVVGRGTVLSPQFESARRQDFEYFRGYYEHTARLSMQRHCACAERVCSIWVRDGRFDAPITRGASTRKWLFAGRRSKQSTRCFDRLAKNDLDHDRPVTKWDDG